MNKIQYVAIGIIAWLLVGCNTQPQPMTTTTVVEEVIPIKEQIAKKVEAELAKEEFFDEIILGHKFGMSKRDVYKHVKRMTAKKKMYRVQKNQRTFEYVYDMKLIVLGNVRCYFDAFYQKDKLFKMVILPRIPKEQTAAAMIPEIIETFEQKYGEVQFTIPSEKETDCNTYLWVIKNLKLEIKCTESLISIIYSDTSMKGLSDREGEL